MKISASIELIWQLAGTEAIAGEYKEIQPEHFCMGLLKFAELSEGQVQGVVGELEVAKVLVAEVHSLRESLAACAINTTQMRRTLRAKLGKGGIPNKADKMHRSPASRELFDLAARLAEDAGNETLTAMHLLAAIVKSPAPAIAQAFRGVDVLAAPRVETPALNKHGEDLIQKYAQGELSSDFERSAECKAVVQLIARKKNVFLVSENDRATQATLFALAKLLNSEDKSPAVKHRYRLIRPVVQEGYEGAKWETVVKIFDDIFHEAAQCKNVILVCSEENLFTSVDPFPVKSAQSSRLAQPSIQCIVPISPKRYDALIKADRNWKRLAEPVWIREEGKKSVPKEL